MSGTGDISQFITSTHGGAPDVASLFTGVAMVDPGTGMSMMAAQHPKNTVGMFLIGFAILLIIIGIIVFSTAKSKTPGTMLVIVALLLGTGGGFLIYKGGRARRLY